MKYQADEKIGVFIDGISFYNAARELGILIDYEKLNKLISLWGNRVRSTYYVSPSEDEEGNSPIVKLIDWLEYNGFSVVSRPSRVFMKEGQERKVKAYLGIDITVDMLEASEWMDHAILLSGDGDFVPLVSALQRKGIKVTVISTIETKIPMIADRLRRQADNFVDLKEILSVVSKEMKEIKSVSFLKEEE